MMKVLTILVVVGGLRPLAAEPLLYQAAKSRRLPVALLKAIVAVESRGNAQAVNRRTWDYGLMQINHLTATRYGYMPFEMLDKRKNIDVASDVLYRLKKQFGHEPTWYCRYNVGWAPNASNWESCRKYVEKICKAGYCILEQGAQGE